jgi:hypothetical protein
MPSHDPCLRFEVMMAKAASVDAESANAKTMVSTALRV